MERAIVALCLLALLGAAAAKDYPMKFKPIPKKESDCLDNLYKTQNYGWSYVKECINYPDNHPDCGKYYKCHNNDGCNTKGGCCDCPLPTLYDVLANNPDTTTAAALLKLLGGDPTAPFTGTLLVPTNAAFEAYLGKMAVNILDPMYKDFATAFLGKLLKYHFLLIRVYAFQMSGASPYSTTYANLNAFPHKVTFVKDDLPCETGCEAARFLVDEQKNTVTFNTVDTIVLGGGVVHTINAVLQPNDIFPSITAAMTSTPFLSNISAIVAQIAALAPQVTSLLESTPGTIAVPLDEAFVGTPIDTIPLQYLVQTVNYHFCPFKKQYRLLYTPFRNPSAKPGKNPCLTWLTNLKIPDFPLPLGNPQWKYGLDYFQTFSQRGQLRPLQQIKFKTGKLPDQLKDSLTTIVFPDITMPLHSAHIVNKLILAPEGLPNPPLGNLGKK